jgi:hypothetical protein
VTLSVKVATTFLGALYYVYEELLILIKFKEYQETNAQNVKQKNPQQDYYITINDILTKPTKKSSHIY